MWGGGGAGKMGHCKYVDSVMAAFSVLEWPCMGMGHWSGYGTLEWPCMGMGHEWVWDTGVAVHGYGTLERSCTGTGHWSGRARVRDTGVAVHGYGTLEWPCTGTGHWSGRARVWDTGVAVHGYVTLEWVWDTGVAVHGYGTLKLRERVLANHCKINRQTCQPKNSSLVFAGSHVTSGCCQTDSKNRGVPLIQLFALKMD